MIDNLRERLNGRAKKDKFFLKNKAPSKKN
jgi:hypothetical protein